MKKKVGIAGLFLGWMLGSHVICFGASGPEKLSMIWYVGPSPAWNYADCNSPTVDADFCVSAGSWWGVCRDKQFGKSENSMKQGATKILEGKVEFSGCPYYDVLLDEGIAKKHGFRPEKAKYWQEACSNERRSIYQFGDSVYFVEIDNNKRKIGLLIERIVTSGKLCDILNKKLPNMVWANLDFEWDELKIEDVWRVNQAFDLNEDNNPEIILSSGLKDFYPAAAAVMISINKSGKVEIISRTVNRPDLYLNSPEKKIVYLVKRAKDECDHWSGEEPYDDERAKEIAEGQKTSCAEFQKILKEVLKKYPENKDIIEMVHRGLKNSDKGQTISNEEMQHRIQTGQK
ncbi:MAG: hypothetical protein ACKVQC_09655 [Elusimicrobiota bacterium]